MPTVQVTGALTITKSLSSGLTVSGIAAGFPVPGATVQAYLTAERSEASFVCASGQGRVDPGPTVSTVPSTGDPQSLVVNNTGQAAFSPSLPPAPAPTNTCSGGSGSASVLTGLKFTGVHLIITDTSNVVLLDKTLGDF